MNEEMNREFANHKTPELITKVHGIWAGSKLQEEFQEEVARLLNRNNSRLFPGAQPVSFAKQHLTELKQRDYYVCEKTDGLRVLMYLTYDGEEPAVYLIDRKNNYYYVQNLFFPHHENDPSKRFHKDTLLDGELVEDKYPGQSPVIKFLAFDLLVIDGKDLRERPLDKRLGYLKTFILKPYKDWLKGGRGPQPFVFEDKKTEFSYSLPLMFNEIIPQVKQLHGNDGLIFTCKGTNYVSGTDPHILKWKPPEENTVDFLMHITWQTTEPDPRDPDQSPQTDYYAIPNRVDLYIYHGRNRDYSYVGELFVTPQDWQDMTSKDAPLQDCIIECFLEDTSKLNGNHPNGEPVPSKRWRYYRLREDKEESNHASVFESVKESIEDSITQQDLLDHADEIRAHWKARDARRPSRAQ